MKKYIFLAFALILGGSYVMADVQIDRGQAKSQAAIKFFIGRYARTNAVGTNGNAISQDFVVIWDTTSNDGVTVNTTTTSNDSLAIGVTMDLIPGSSRDNSAASDDAYNNWGRIQTWGRYADVSYDGNVNGVLAGHRVGTGGVAGIASVFESVSSDHNDVDGYASASVDSFGVLLEAPSAGDKTVDIFLNN